MKGRHFAEMQANGLPKSTVGSGDRSLRLVLSSLLGVLVVVALVASSNPRSRGPLVSTGSLTRLRLPTTTSRSSPSAPRGSVQPGPAPATSRGSTTTLRTRPGQEATAGHGCGLGLGARSAPRPMGRCTVLEIGDSLGGDLGWGLARRLGPASGMNLVEADKASTGLANTSFWNWPAQLATDLSRFHPQLVVVSLGGNDEQGLYVDGSAVQFPTPAWKAAYAARVHQIVREATAASAYVLWVGMPIMQQPEFSQGMQVLNSLYEQGVASDPNAVFLSVWKLFADPAGRYVASAEVNGSSTSLREPDGVHYSYAGEDVIATYVLQRLATLFQVQLTPLDPAVITGWS